MTVVNRDFCGLSADSEPAWLTYAEAARRVKSSKHTVQVWRREGMPMEWRVDEGGRRFRVVELQTLLSWWRRKMQNSPVTSTGCAGRRSSVARLHLPSLSGSDGRSAPI